MNQILQKSHENKFQCSSTHFPKKIFIKTGNKCNFLSQTTLFVLVIWSFLCKLVGIFWIKMCRMDRRSLMSLELLSIDSKRLKLDCHLFDWTEKRFVFNLSPAELFYTNLPNFKEDFKRPSQLWTFRSAGNSTKSQRPLQCKSRYTSRAEMHFKGTTMSVQIFYLFKFFSGKGAQLLSTLGSLNAFILAALRGGYAKHETV